jgi:HD-like signal output (HDOD) protein
MLPSSLQPLPRSRTGQPPHFIGGGGPRPGVLDEEAKAVLLARLADNPPLPTPPAIALQVLEKASHPACNLQEIDGLISADPALCAKLLRTVNSALYGLPRAVTSVRQAFNLFGINAVRSLVLSLSLPVLQRSGQPDRPFGEFQDFCKSSVAGAIVARELALRLDWPGPEDHLIAGLLRDLGVLVLPKVFPDAAARFRELPRDEAALRPCEFEEEYFGLHHAEISAHLVRHWRLPAEISEPIRYHHHPELAQQRARPQAPRAALLYFASQVAQLLLTPRQPELLRNILAVAAKEFGMNEAQVMQFLEPLNRRVEEFAALIQADIGVCENFPTLLASATEELIKLSVATSLENLRERDRRSQAEQEARQWRRTAEQVRNEAVRDPLTGCYNRGFFKNALGRAYKVARRRCSLLGLIFLDLDGFKTLNDRFGHLFGDQVLQSVAAKLHAGVRARISRLATAATSSASSCSTRRRPAWGRWPSGCGPVWRPCRCARVARARRSPCPSAA